eukprot:TRINITY_DN8867_c0_g1_i1.p1 TRINITY_DN8867_c0_g1~~TRINITY_DN8867_c0_g1_i1.p1  ORF type:complete len:771 (+),score=98.25 TRINITY_DN8867_c0_g1_i1:34-2313(+)
MASWLPIAKRQKVSPTVPTFSSVQKLEEYVSGPRCSSQRAEEVEEILHYGGIRPGPQTYVVLLRKVASSEIGLDKMYAAMLKCPGHEPTIAHFNAVIHGYAIHARVLKAFGIYDEVLRRKLTPDDETFTGLFRCCARAKDAGRAIGLLNEAQLSGMALGTRAYTTFMNACATSTGGGHHALLALDKMKAKGVTISAATYAAALDSCARSGLGGEALVVLAELRAMVPRPLDRTFTSVIAACGRAGMGQQALALLDEMCRGGGTPDRVAFEYVIEGCAHCGLGTEAGRVFRQMTDAGFAANLTSFHHLLAAYATAGMAREALRAYAEVQSVGLTATVATFNLLIAACLAGNLAAEALHLLPEMRQRGIKPEFRTFTGLIDACAATGLGEKALCLINEMKEAGFACDPRTLRVALHACGRGGNGTPALQIYRELRELNENLDASSVSALLQACSAEGLAKEALAIWEETHNDFEIDKGVYLLLVDALMRDPDTQAAVSKLLSTLQSKGVKPDAAIYERMLAAESAKEGSSGSALGLLEEMQQAGFPPSESSYEHALASCALDRNGKAAGELITQMEKKSLTVTAACRANLIRALSRSGETSAAIAVFQNCVRKEEPICVAILEAYCAAGAMEEAEKLLRALGGPWMPHCDVSVACIVPLLKAYIANQQYDSAGRLLSLGIQHELQLPAQESVTVIQNLVRLGNTELAARIFNEFEHSWTEDELGPVIGLPGASLAVAQRVISNLRKPEALAASAAWVLSLT